MYSCWTGGGVFGGVVVVSRGVVGRPDARRGVDMLVRPRRNGGEARRLCCEEKKGTEHGSRSRRGKRGFGPTQNARRRVISSKHIICFSSAFCLPLSALSRVQLSQLRREVPPSGNATVIKSRQTKPCKAKSASLISIQRASTPRPTPLTRRPSSFSPPAPPHQPARCPRRARASPPSRSRARAPRRGGLQGG